MKHLKSTHSDLQRLFTQNITIREISEALVTFDINHSCKEVRKFMEERDFDVVGVLDGGSICGYARREMPAEGVLKQVIIPFKGGDVMAESEPLLQALKALQDRPFLFVRFLGNPCGIITRSDLQKAPIRLWLFGLITLLEMQMLRCIRICHPDDSWKSSLGGDSIAKAEDKWKKLTKRNEATCLSDCLTLDDKARIFWNSPRLFKLTGSQNKTDWRDFAARLRELRNDLAHAGDLAPENWSKLSANVERIEKLLMKIEASNH